MQNLGPAPALTPKQIIAEHATSLREVSEAAVDPQFELERITQINQSWRNYRFVNGEHFIIPGLVDSPFGQIVDYVGITGDESNPEAKLLRPVNFIGGDGYKFIAVLGNSAPRVKAVADDPEDPDAIEDAKNADATLRDLWTKWKADQLQRIMAFHQYATGPTYWRTVWTQNRSKYGETIEPSVDLVPDPNGGPPMPVEGPPRTYVNGDVELHYYTVFEVSHPYMARSLEECDYFIIEQLRSKWNLLATYAGEIGPDGKPQPGPLDQYRDSDPPDDDQKSSSQTAFQAAEAVANPSGMGRAKRTNQWRHREEWYQPYLFESIQDVSVREMFKRQFPDGLYIARVCGLPVALENRKLTKEVSVCKTGRGERIIERPICNDTVPIQQTINDLFGLAVETVLRAIAKTIVDSQLLNRESLRKNDAAPAEIVLTAMPADGSDLSKHIAQIQPARLSDQVVPLIQLFRAQMQDISGVRPELSGGGQPTQTYREAKQRKDQALLQLSPQAQEMQNCWQAIGENGVRMLAKYGSGTIKVPRKGSFGAEADTVDLAELSEDGWHTEADDNFPMNASDRFDKMWSVLKDFSPEVQQLLGVLDPINLEETIELLQIPGFNTVSEEQKKKTLADIAELIKGAPIQGQDGANQPSIPIDQYDDHAFVADFTRKWMVSRTGQKVKGQQQQGFENVMAWQQLHFQAAQPPLPEPPPPVRAALSVSGKDLQDLPPAFANVMLQGAGLSPMPNVPPQPPMPESGFQGTASESGPGEPANPDTSPSEGPTQPPMLGNVSPPSDAPQLLQ